MGNAKSASATASTATTITRPNGQPQQQIVIQESKKMDVPTIVGIVIGVAVAATALGLMVWIFTKKKPVKQAGKTGKKYKKSSKLDYAKCIIQPKNWTSNNSCNKPVKSNPSASNVQNTKTARVSVTPENIAQVMS